MAKLEVKNTAGMVRVAFERQLLQIAICALLFITLGQYTAQAQVLNDDRFQYELYIGLVQPLVNGDSGIGPQDEWVAQFIAQTDFDNSASTLGAIDKCGPIFRVDPGEIVVGPDDNDDGIIDGRANIIISPLAQDENSAGVKAIDINMRVFEDDSRSTGDDCSTSPIENDATNVTLLTIDESTVDNFIGGQNFAGAVEAGTGSLGANVTVAYAWRYARGESGNPLAFGAIDFNNTKTHLNSNRIKPVLSSTSTALGIHTSSLNYPDLDGPPSRDAGEVYYSFSIDSQSKVTISTGTTSFETFLILRRSDGSLRASDSDGIMEDLILTPDTYTIVVDGEDGGGQFELSVLRELENPPSNRDCTSPKELTCGTLLSGEDNTGVGSDDLSDCGNGTQHNALWYRFEGDGSTIRLDVEQASFTANIDLLINNDQANCNDLDCRASGTGSLVFKTSQGLPYWIVVYGDDTDDFGAFDLRFRCINGAANDKCDDATFLTCGDTITDSTTFSRPFFAPSCLAENDQSVPFSSRYYTFTGDGSLYDITYDVESGILSVMYVYTRSCAELLCQAESLSASNTIPFQTQEDQTYTILIASSVPNTPVVFDLSISCCNPTTDMATCATAVQVPDISWGLFGSQVGFESSCVTSDNTVDGPPSCLPSYEGGDRWYAFTSPPTGAITLDIPLTGSSQEKLDEPIGIEIFENCNAPSNICMIIPAGRTDTLLLDENEDYLMRVTQGFEDREVFALTFRELCPSVVDIDQFNPPLPNVVASQSISSNHYHSFVQSYSAKDSIILQPGFEIPLNKPFEILTNGCSAD